MVKTSESYPIPPLLPPIARVGHGPESSLNHRLDAVYSLEIEDCGLKVWGEEQQVEKLSHSRACEAELPRERGAVCNLAIVDQSLQVMREGEHARDLRGAPDRSSGFGDRAAAGITTSKW